MKAQEIIHCGVLKFLINNFLFLYPNFPFKLLLFDREVILSIWNSVSSEGLTDVIENPINRKFVLLNQETIGNLSYCPLKFLIQIINSLFPINESHSLAHDTAEWAKYFTCNCYQYAKEWSFLQVYQHHQPYRMPRKLAEGFKIKKNKIK